MERSEESRAKVGAAGSGRGGGKSGRSPGAGRGKVRVRARISGESCVDRGRLARGWPVSTDRFDGPGGKADADAAVAEAKALVDAAEAVETEQLDLLAEPITTEEMLQARERLGPKAGNLTVLREAREERKRGRTPGSRNRRTDDFVRYLSQFGPDPAVVLMQIVGTPPEVMVEQSAALDPVKRRLSLGDAQALRVRAAETLMPYFHGKQPVRVDATIRGVIVQEIIGGHEHRGVLIDADPLGVLPFDDEDEPV